MCIEKELMEIQGGGGCYLQGVMGSREGHGDPEGDMGSRGLRKIQRSRGIQRVYGDPEGLWRSRGVLGFQRGWWDLEGVMGSRGIRTVVFPTLRTFAMPFTYTLYTTMRLHLNPYSAGIDLIVVRIWRLWPSDSEKKNCPHVFYKNNSAL